MKRTALWLLAALSLGAHAAPAAWYWWISTSTGQRVCSQTSPGEGWTRGRGPFSDSRCERKQAV